MSKFKRGQIFQNTPHNKLPKSGFPLSYSNTFTTDIGRLTPVMCQDVIPGDTFKVDDVILTRFMPMLSPVMGKITGTVRYFFVPERLLWNKFKDFITGGKDGTLEPSKPTVNIYDLADLINGTAPKSLYDYLGGGDCPGLEDKVLMDLAPFTAYNLIYQEYYRDQNVGEDFEDLIEWVKSQEGEVSLISTVDPQESIQFKDTGFFDVKQKCWKKDYFTSALPWAQRGPAVTIPIGTSAPVSIPVQPATLGISSKLGDSTQVGVLNFIGLDTAISDVDTSIYNTNNTGSAVHEFLSMNDGSKFARIRGNLGGGASYSQEVPPLVGSADLSQVTGITINDLRLLARTQRWAEMNAVGGGRYNEQTLAHWDELIPDFTIQRPVYLGGGSFPVQISEVLQTAQVSENGTTSATDQGVGNMYGHGLAVSGKPGFRRTHFREHGWIIGLISFMPEVSYFQGLPRKFTRFDKFDYAWYEFAHLGEQEIKNKEIYIEAEDPEGTFGYQSRFAEYKYNPDEIHGDFRSSLLYWTLARKFGNEPKLNENFMKINANVINRIFAVTDSTEDHIMCMLYHRMPSTRKLPKYGMPGIHIL